MTTRTVISRTRHVESPTSQTFTFDRAMIPGVQDGEIQDFIKDYRLRAWDLFENSPMPSTSEEAWRRTDVHGLKAGQFRLPSIADVEGMPAVPDEILKPMVAEQHSGQIVLLPGGKVLSKYTQEIQDKGVIFCDLLTAEKQHPDILALIMGQIVRADEGKFAALAASLAQTGVLVYVPRGVQLEYPLHSILWGPGTGYAYLSHILVWLEDGASITYVHEYASPTEEDGQTLHAGMVEVYAGQGASLRYVELQSWGAHVWNFTHERVRVGRDATVDWIFGAIGSHLTKNFSELDLVGEGATGRMSGFYFTDGNQHLDHDTQQNHMAAHTTSDLLFKGALKGQSRSVWQGMIYVAPSAQRTDGYQANRNLVLSPAARADSIPGLEILADDVRCTHGATVGKIDAEQLFYLRSRGIPYAEAERLIVEGFFDPIMQRIPFEGVRSRFQEAIIAKMSQ